MSNSGIYKIQHIKTGKLYIGSAIDIEHRWGGHIRQLRRGVHHSVKLQNAWNKYGSEMFAFSVLEFVDDPSKLLEREQYWIDFAKAAKSGYNMTPTAGSLLGHKFTEGTKEKMSKSATGHIKSPEHRKSLSLVNTGKKMSDESRQKMREAKLGKKRAPHSEATRAKMSAKAIGRTFSDETLSKMAAAKLGKKQSQEHLNRRLDAIRSTVQSPEYVSPFAGRKLKPEAIAKREATKKANRAAMH